MSTANHPADGAAETIAVEAARAEWYGLLAALFYRPPGTELHAGLRAAPRAAADSGVELAAAWDALLETAAVFSTAELAAEYDALFGGVGKPDVYLFGSHYLAGFLNERPLVELRDDLRAFGIMRADNVIETEDHIACLLDTMQQLILAPAQPDQAGEGAATLATASDGTLQQQRKLFDRHIASWTDMLCAALSSHPKAGFYARLADLLLVFVAIERQAFEMMEAEGDPSPQN